MKIGITADHRGYKLKTELYEKLKSEYDIVDLGCKNTESVDYPDYAFKLGEKIKEKKLDFGIAICGSGIGISIACNKVEGVRAARIVCLDDVYETRKDNNANIICLSEKVSLEDAYQLVKTFLNTPFSNEERHNRRIAKIIEYEREKR